MNEYLDIIRTFRELSDTLSGLDGWAEEGQCQLEAEDMFDGKEWNQLDAIRTWVQQAEQTIPEFNEQG